MPHSTDNAGGEHSAVVGEHPGIVGEQRALLQRQVSELQERAVETQQLRESVEQQRREMEQLQRRLTAANRDALRYAQMERSLEDLSDEKQRLTARLVRQDKQIEELTRQASHASGQVMEGDRSGKQVDGSIKQVDTHEELKLSADHQVTYIAPWTVPDNASIIFIRYAMQVRLLIYCYVTK